jgi:hypothetical protein
LPRLHRLANADTDAMHYSDEKLYEGAIFCVNKPGTQINGRAVVVRRIDSHPGNDTPGTAHARVEEQSH